MGRSAAVVIAVLLAFVATALAPGRAQAAGAAYAALDIGPAGSTTAASGLNDLGDVVGTLSSGERGPWQPFLFTGGPLSLLELGSLARGDTGTPTATAVNNHDAIVGSWGSYNGFLSSNGIVTDLGSFRPTDINDSGQIAGTGNGAMIYSDGRLRALVPQARPSESTAAGINNAGDVVGDIWVSSGGYHAFLSTAGALRDLGTLGGPSSYAEDVSDAGAVVGYSDTGRVAENGWSQEHAFVYRGGVMRDLGALDGQRSVAHSVNSAGDVVGESEVQLASSGLFERRAVLWSGGSMVDLNYLIAPGCGTLESAVRINEAGQILATGRRYGVEHSFLLTPVAPGASPPSCGSRPARERLQGVRDALLALAPTLPTRAERLWTTRSAESVGWALEPQRWTPAGQLVDGGEGLGALQALRTAAGRIHWTALRGTAEHEKQLMVGAMAELVRQRFDAAWSALHHDTRYADVLWKAERDLRDGDLAARDPGGPNMQATLDYIRAWQRLSGMPAG